MGTLPLMKARRIGYALLAAALLVVGTAGAAAAANQNDADVQWFADGEAVGSSRLVTNGGGASLQINTGSLPAGHAYTFWFVVFNDPESCTDGECGEDDVFEYPELANVSVLYGAGRIVGGNGSLNIGAHLGAGDTDGALFGPGLLYPTTAEIHIVVRSHGPAVPGLISEQLHTVGGGCAVDITPAVPTNEGECGDVQFAVHQQ